MKIKLLITVVMSSAAGLALVASVPAALAQTPPPPAAAEKPAAPKKRAAPAKEVAPKGVSIAEKAQKCRKIPVDPQARLDCYDAAVKPELNPNPPPVKGIRDCRHLVDKNDRLGCFDGFAEQIPKFTH
ncbi:hypothetical protein [Bradyrhizobium sp.]|uniref:hypothetical protein n=1 Tax=Bradyrhizobium sp. TaxID=376 RepID=UPI00261BB63B|nr:hypothetical protein [Bradyrhizobium sp.]